MNLNQNKWIKSIKNSKNSVVLDVRTPEEFEEGFIRNSVNLNIYDSQFFFDEIKKLKKESCIHVYCKSGARSFQACELMKQFGFQNVFNLEGGILEWKGEILNN
tara:strand:- start:569 stop:880 length:312 start_codon:yes stop_codon:yes gene_type:complete